jgi:hypothetical protein
LPFAFLPQGKRAACRPFALAYPHLAVFPLVDPSIFLISPAAFALLPRRDDLVA